jgi:Patatin-like phospholipase
VSTGALIAPFAYLGPDYDDRLAEVYTTIDQRDIFEKRPLLAAVAGDGMSDTTPLQNLIARNFDERLLAEIRREYGRGRLLFVITTDLDAGRPVIWNLGAIAESDHPDALKLARKILLASAAIPAVFPPVMFDVTADGRSYQELHVDGGAFAQTYLYPPALALGRLKGIGNRQRTAYLIRNGKLREEWDQTERKTLSIATRAVSSLITSSGVGDLYRIYTVTKRDGVGFRLAYIEDDFKEPHPDQFDRGYMNNLFDYARGKARKGYPWHKGPPGFD